MTNNVTKPKISKVQLEPYIIAEIGVNHEGSLTRAFELIESAKRGGAHAAKFQTYKADMIAAKNSPAYWDLGEEPTDSQHKLFQKYESFDQKEYTALANHCAEVGIDFMSTPFDLESIEWLAPLMKKIKIASADITFVPLLRKAARTGLPVILSTGASELDEIRRAVATLSESGAQSITLLHCVLNYPTAPENAQIGYMARLRQEFPNLNIGYSDHVKPDNSLSALTAALIEGASIIEKHFTYDKSLPGNDHYHAMDEQDLTKFTSFIKTLNGLLKVSDGKDLDNEILARRHARRSIYAAHEIPAGKVVTASDLICKRPVKGIPSQDWDLVIGRTIGTALAPDHAITWDDLV